MINFILENLDYILGVILIIIIILVSIMILIRKKEETIIVNNTEYNIENNTQTDISYSEINITNIVEYDKRFEELEKNDELSVIHSVNEMGENIIIRYNKSFASRLHRADDKVLEFYSTIKNEVLKYRGINAKMSWSHERISAGKETLGYLRIRGKTLVLYLRLTKEDMVDSKYSYDDISNVKKYEETPILYKINGPRRLEYAIELIQKTLQKYDVIEVNNTYDPNNYRRDYPVKGIKKLIEEGLIKEVVTIESKVSDLGKSINKKIPNLKEVTDIRANELISDEEAKKLVSKESGYISKEKIATINIEELSNKFKANERIDLKILINKKLVSTESTYLKIEGKGKINKPLIIRANEFDLTSLKMNALIGGECILIIDHIM